MADPTDPEPVSGEDRIRLIRRRKVTVASFALFSVAIPAGAIVDLRMRTQTGDHWSLGFIALATSIVFILAHGGTWLTCPRCGTSFAGAFYATCANVTDRIVCRQCGLDVTIIAKKQPGE